jgi:molybdopterin molybdotransferase
MREFLGLGEALTLLESRVDALPRGRETVSLHDARGRITANAIAAPMDLPPFPASAMDGYAVSSGDPVFAAAPPYRLPLQGVSRAGTPLPDALRVDHAVRIFTGAAVPARCDAVVIQEQARATDDYVELLHRPSAGDYVRPVGHDVAHGAPIIDAGTRLGPFELAWLSACGRIDVEVVPRVRLALFSTGDELRDAPATLVAGQIYDANRTVVAELLRTLPVEIDDLGIVPDDPDAIEATLATAAANHDAVITSGGVSVGDADHVKGVVERLGSLEFWKIAIRPGKPFAYGRIGNCRLFGLPGNPVSTIVTFLLLVKPVLLRLAGTREYAPLRMPATLLAGVQHEAGRAEYQRGHYTMQSDGIVVAPTSDQSSNRLGSFYGANCLIEIPRECGDLDRGTTVTVLPFEGLLG